MDSNAPIFQILRIPELLDSILLFLPPSAYASIRLAHPIFNTAILTSPTLKWLTFKTLFPPRSIQKHHQYHVRESPYQVSFHPLFGQMITNFWYDLKTAGAFHYRAQDRQASASRRPIQWPEDVYLTMPPLKSFSVMIMNPMMEKSSHKKRYVDIAMPDEAEGFTVKAFFDALKDDFLVMVPKRDRGPEDEKKGWLWRRLPSTPTPEPRPVAVMLMVHILPRGPFPVDWKGAQVRLPSASVKITLNSWRENDEVWVECCNGLDIASGWFGGGKGEPHWREEDGYDTCCWPARRG